jgi:hypothetical protein
MIWVRHGKLCLLNCLRVHNLKYTSLPMSKLSTSASITTIYSSKDLICHYTQKLKPFSQRLGEELLCNHNLFIQRLNMPLHPEAQTILSKTWWRAIMQDHRSITQNWVVFSFPNDRQILSAHQSSLLQRKNWWARVR